MFTPNRFGIYDLAGNVYQWVADWFDGSHSGRTYRGSDWSFSERSRLLSSRRGHGLPDSRDVNSGFRCVLSAPPTGASHISAVQLGITAASDAREDFLTPLYRSICKSCALKVAVRQGFEPWVPFKGYNALAKRRFRPLSHLTNGSGETMAAFSQPSKVFEGEKKRVRRFFESRQPARRPITSFLHVPPPFTLCADLLRLIAGIRQLLFSSRSKKTDEVRVTDAAATAAICGDDLAGE